MIYHLTPAKESREIAYKYIRNFELFAHEEASAAVSMLQLESEQKASERRRKYNDSDTRIDKFGLAYITTERTLDSYISAIGHLMDRKC